MRFSIFTPFGHLAFSSKTPYAQTIYEERIRNLGDGKVWTDEFGSLVSTHHYSAAMVIAGARLWVEHAGNQFRPYKMVELLREYETQHGIIPNRFATISQRQAEIDVAVKIARGANYGNVISALTTLLGSGFISYQSTPIADVTQTTNVPGSTGNYVKPGTPAVFVKITSSVAIIDSPITVNYSFVGGFSDGLKSGQKLWVDGGDYGRVETVEISDVTSTQFTATFTQPHNANTYGSTGRAPFHGSTKRVNAVMVTAEVARDPEKRRKINKLMRKILRNGSIWSIVEENTPGSGVSGPFTLNSSELGFHSLIEVTA
jgi:hypothetical protein